MYVGKETNPYLTKREGKEKGEGRLHEKNFRKFLGGTPGT